MKAYVGVTDSRWSSFLATRPYLNEVNFWVPGGGPRAWRVTAPNDVVLFKSKAPSNVIVGGGIHTDYRQLPVSLAWDVWGEGNGAGSLEEMRQLIGLNRHAPIAHSEDPVVGCLMLRDVAFFDESEPMSAPENFAANIVSGKGYALRPGGTSAVELAVARLLDGRASMSEVRMDRQEVEFAPRLVWGRLGRESFKASVAAAYGLRCAITGAKILPVLQAAHIKSVAAGGQHSVDNGLLLRADVHVMFDRGLLGVHPTTANLQVSSLLRSTFGNGEEFYQRAGQPITLPARLSDRPNREFLTWHMDEVFTT